MNKRNRLTLNNVDINFAKRYYINMLNKWLKLCWNGRITFSFFFIAGSQIEAHGRITTERCHRSGHTPSNPNANLDVGGEFGTTALRTISLEVLHGIVAKWRIAKSEGTSNLANSLLHFSLFFFFLFIYLIWFYASVECIICRRWQAKHSTFNLCVAASAAQQAHIFDRKICCDIFSYLFAVSSTALTMESATPVDIWSWNFSLYWTRIASPFHIFFFLLVVLLDSPFAVGRTCVPDI